MVHMRWPCDGVCPGTLEACGPCLKWRAVFFKNLVPTPCNFVRCHVCLTRRRCPDPTYVLSPTPTQPYLWGASTTWRSSARGAHARRARGSWHRGGVVLTHDSPRRAYTPPDFLTVESRRHRHISLPTRRFQVHSSAHASSQRHSYMASARPRHAFANEANSAFNAGALLSAAALSQCAAASSSSAAERGPTSSAAP